jgi:hypothetical protein
VNDRPHGRNTDQYAGGITRGEYFNRLFAAVRHALIETPMSLDYSLIVDEAFLRLDERDAYVAVLLRVPQFPALAWDGASSLGPRATNPSNSGRICLLCTSLKRSTRTCTRLIMQRSIPTESRGFATSGERRPRVCHRERRSKNPDPFQPVSAMRNRRPPE